MSKYKFLFILIILFGLSIRLFKLDEIPPGLTWDEAALGYNAYSIIQTGKDEYGNFMPLNLRSFGDYKPALYTYLDIPFIFILGLNEFAVRLPSVFAGVGFIVLSYLIVWEIFKEKKLALFTAFFAAVSPISILFSRAAYESNVAVFLNLSGLYFFLKGFKNSKYYYFSAVSLVLSLFSYQGSKLFVPLLLFGLLILYRKKINKVKDLKISLGIVIFGILSVFIITFGLGQSDRLRSQNLFAYTRSEEIINQIAKENGLDKNSFVFQTIHGEWLEFIKGIMERYFAYFSPDILFAEGDYSPRYNAPDMGILNYYAMLLLPFGFYLLWRKKEDDKKIILYWLFIASIPAVLSRDLISMVRALNLMFPFAALEAFGLYYLLMKIAKLKKVIGWILYALLILVIGGNLFYYFDLYFVHLPKDNAKGWLYGYKEMIGNLPDTSKYNKVIISDIYGQPYIYYLFFTKYPPQKFQEQAVLEQNTVDVGTVRNIDNIEFREVNWPVDRGSENALVIGSNSELPDGDIESEKKSKKIYEVNFPGGENAFKIVENGYE